MPHLSKTRFLSGLQCHKRLYFDCYDRELADPIDPGTQARFDIGHEVGELARKLRPGGVLIDEDHRHHTEAMASTQRKLANRDVPALYEAAFEHQGVLIRADILARLADGTFELIEVKSSTSVKPVYEPDVAIQLWVLEGCGIPVSRAMLAHLDNTYVYQGGEYDLDRLFVLNDLTDTAREDQAGYVAELDAMRDMLAQDERPDIDIGPQRLCSPWFP